MAKHSWSLWDGMKCVEVGSVEAPDETAAIKAVSPTVALRPERSYRVRVGQASASFYPDEFARVKADQSKHELDPARKGTGSPYLFSDMVKKLDAARVSSIAADQKLKEALENKAKTLAEILKEVAEAEARGLTRSVPAEEVLQEHAKARAKVIERSIVADALKRSISKTPVTSPHQRWKLLDLADTPVNVSGHGRRYPIPEAPLHISGGDRRVIRRLKVFLESYGPDLPLTQVGHNSSFGEYYFTFGHEPNTTKHTVTEDFLRSLA